jgi:AGZA family xanthine/uracil permease-like MFS transporter
MCIDYINANLPYYCAKGILRNPTMWLGIFTGGSVAAFVAETGKLIILPFSRIFTIVLMMYGVCGAILMGILLTAIISWPRFTPVTYFPQTATGDAMYNYFKQIVAFRKLEKVGNAINVRHS